MQPASSRGLARSGRWSDAYGWDVVNGWLIKLVPYLKNSQTGNFTVRNPLLDDLDGQVSTNVLPSGVSQVPFRCRWQGETEDMASGPWVRFCDLADGSFIVIELRLTYKKGWKVVRVGPARGAVNPIVAWSFAEFLDRAVESAGRFNMLYAIA